MPRITSKNSYKPQKELDLQVDYFNGGVNVLQES